MQKRIFYHIAFWAGYVLFKTYMQVDFTQPLPTHMFLTMLAGQLMFMVVKIPMVYALFFIIDRYMERQWSMGKTIAYILGLFVVTLAFFIPVKQFLVLQWIYGRDATLKAGLGLTSIFSAVFILGFVCSIAVAVKLIRSNMQQRRLQQEAIKHKLETELRYLKAQVNPHFLFNTLNNIYALTRKKSDQAPEVVLKLSRLFRFILYEAQRPFISIVEEVQVLDNYIELERIRYNDKLRLNFSRNIDKEDQPIAPLILLPLVENAFKHGASESRFDSYININLEVKDGWLFFECENSKASENTGNEQGIGLENIRRQLELIYTMHSLEVNNGPAIFTVILKIDLASNDPSLLSDI